MTLFAVEASTAVEPLASGLVCAGASCAEAGSGAELSVSPHELALVRRWRCKLVIPTSMSSSRELNILCSYRWGKDGSVFDLCREARSVCFANRLSWRGPWRRPACSLRAAPGDDLVADVELLGVAGCRLAWLCPKSVSRLSVRPARKNPCLAQLSGIGSKQPPIPTA